MKIPQMAFILFFAIIPFQITIANLGIGAHKPTLKPQDELTLCKQINNLEEQIELKKEFQKSQQNELNKVIESKIFLGIFKEEERKQINTFLGWKLCKENLIIEKKKVEKKLTEKLEKLEEKYEMETKGPIEDLMRRMEEIFRNFEGEKLRLKKEFETKKLKADKIYENEFKNLNKIYLEWKESKKAEFKEKIEKLKFAEAKKKVNEKWTELEAEYSKKFGKKSKVKSSWRKRGIGNKNMKRKNKKIDGETPLKLIPKTAIKCVLAENDDNETKNAQKLMKLMELVDEEERAIREEMGGGKNKWQFGKAIQAVRVGVHLMGIANAKKEKGHLKKMVEIFREEEKKQQNELDMEDDESESNSTIFSDSECLSKSSISSFSPSSSLSSQDSFNNLNNWPNSLGRSMNSEDFNVDSSFDLGSEFTEDLPNVENGVDQQTEKAIENSPELLKKLKDLQNYIGELENKKEIGKKIKQEFEKLKAKKLEKIWKKKGKLTKILRAAHFHAYLELAIDLEAKMEELKENLENLYKNEKLYSIEPKMLLSPEKFLEKVGTTFTDECERAKTRMEWAIGDIEKKLGQIAKLERNLMKLEKNKIEMEKLMEENIELKKLLGEKGVEEKCEELIEYSQFVDAKSSLEFVDGK